MFFALLAGIGEKITQNVPYTVWSRLSKLFRRNRSSPVIESPDSGKPSLYGQVETAVVFFFQGYSERCIGFIEKESKTADTTPKDSTIQTRHHADNNTIHTSQATRLVLHRLPPRMARRGYTKLLGRVTT
jgi:hypothetical protein